MLQTLDFLIGGTLALFALTFFTGTIKAVVVGTTNVSLLGYIVRSWITASVFLFAWWFFTTGIRAVVEAF